MRRNDRHVTDPAQIRAILDRCKVLRLAMTDGERPYIVPLNYGYRMSGDRVIFYFHCAKEGRKLDLLRRNPNVCVEIDCAHGLSSGGEVACQYGYFYQSIVAEGVCQELTDSAQRAQALELLMHCQTGRTFCITAAQAASVCVFRIDVTDLSAKARLPEAPLD